MAKDSDQDQWFPCKVCEKVFPSVGARNKHLKIHLEKNHICNICGKRFNDVSNRNAHEKNVHSHNEIIFKCTECGKKFKYKRSLADHIKQIHSSQPAVIPSDAHDLPRLSGVDVAMYPQEAGDVEDGSSSAAVTMMLADEIFPEVDGAQEEQQAGMTVPPGMMEICSEAPSNQEIEMFNTGDTGTVVATTHAGHPLHDTEPLVTTTRDTDTRGGEDPDHDIATTTASSVMSHTALNMGHNAAIPGTTSHGGGLDPNTDPVATLSSIGTGDTDTSGGQDPEERDVATNNAASSVLLHSALNIGQDAADPGTPGHGGGLDPATDPAATLSSIRTGDTDTGHDPERDLATNTAAAGHNAADPGTTGHVHFSDGGLDPAINPLVTGTLVTDPDTELPGTSHNMEQDGADTSGDGGLDPATDRAALSSIAMINAAEIDLSRSGLQLSNSSDGGEQLSKVSVTIGDNVVTYFDYGDSNEGSFMQHMMDFESSSNNIADKDGSKEHDNDNITPAVEAAGGGDELLDQRSQGSNENSEIVVVDGREDGIVEQNGSNESEKKNKYECTVCGKKFARKQYYRIHHQAHFLGAKYNCPKCDKKFEQKKHMNYHLKYIHPEDSDVLLKCNDCGKKFKHPQSLKEHKFRHELGEKTYSAKEKKEALELVEQVGKAKAAKRLGISYRTLAYWESRKQKIVCRFCGKELSSNRRLKEHEKSMHNQHNEN